MATNNTTHPVSRRLSSPMATTTKTTPPIPPTTVLFLPLTLLLLSSSPVSPFMLEGSDVSYAKFLPLKLTLPLTSNASVLLEFNTNQPDGLLLYTDDVRGDGFLELKLVEASLRLRFNVNGAGTQVITVGRHLNDGLWHRVDIKVAPHELSLTVDGFVTQGRSLKGLHIGATGPVTSEFGFVYVGGLPVTYNDKISDLSLPSVVFEPRFRGAVRNIVYSHQHKPQDIVESKGLVSGPGEACERHDPCQHSGYCISTDHGPICDCKHIDFEGPHCEREKSPVEATFVGGEYVGYDFREAGGEPIVSTLDEVSFLFKTKPGHRHDGLLFYSGDGVDYLSLSLRDGRIAISINLGNGPLDAAIHPDHLRFDDYQWHSVRVHRKVQEMAKTTSLCHITASVDGLHFDRWTLAGSFTLLSSNRVTVGGYDMMRPLPGIKGVSNYVGCLRKVEYRADTLRLSLLELAKAGNRLVSVSGRLQFKCNLEHDLFDNNIPPSGRGSSSQGGGGGVVSSESIVKTLAGGTVTFTTPESFLVLPPWNNASRSGALSLKIRTTEPNGLILYAKNERQTDYVCLELLEGQLFVHLDLGTGPLRIQSTSDPVDDGEWHHIKLVRSGRSGTISVDDLSTDFNTKGDSTRLELDSSSVYLGYVPESVVAPPPAAIWSLNLRAGFVGCVRALVVDNVGVDLAAVALQQDNGAVRGVCQVGSAGSCVGGPCLNNGRCVEGWGRFTCECVRAGFQGAVCQRETPLYSLDGTRTLTTTSTSTSSTGFPPVEATDVVLRFRTSRKTSTILTITTKSSDFLELSLESGRLKLRVRLGDREKTLTTGHDLHDRNWHTTTCSRRGNALKFQVDDVPPLNSEVPTRTTSMRPIKIELGSLTSPFIGDIQGVQYNKEDLTFDGRSKKSNLILNPVSFKSRDAYVGLGQLKAYWRADLHFYLKTTEADGVVLFNSGRGNEYFAVEVFDNGRLGVSYATSDVGYYTAATEKPINNNVWVKVWIRFDVGGASGDMGGMGGGSRLIVGGDDNLPGIKFQRVGGGAAIPKQQFLDLNGILYLGGLPEGMYESLPRQVRSRGGYMGCIASIELGGEYVNPATDALVPSNLLQPGCEDASSRCTSDSCSNGGTCSEQWSGLTCDCDMTSFTGPTCSQESTSYDFGPGRGVLLFMYPSERRPDTRVDSIAFGFLTADPDAVLLRIDSAKTTDYLEIELLEGRVRVLYNMGSREQSIGDLSRRVNDRAYHVLRFRREGPNATFQIDNWDVVARNPPNGGGGGSSNNKESSVFNRQSLVHVGGKWRPNKRQVERPYQGVLSGLVVNGLRLLDMGTDRDPRVRTIGQVRQIASIGSIPPLHSKDDLHYMQKTTASLTPGVHDDLVYSGESRCLPEDDEDDECSDAGGGSARHPHQHHQVTGDELITPVYVPRPRPPSTTPPQPPRHHQKPTKDKVCDDEDCIVDGNGGAGGSGSHAPTSTWPSSSSSSNNQLITSTTGDEDDVYGTPPRHTAVDWTSTSSHHRTPSTTTYHQTNRGSSSWSSSTSSRSTPPPSSTTAFVPPHLPSPPTFVPGRDFDFQLTTQSTSTSTSVSKVDNVEGTVYLAEPGDSTLIIIIIIAVLMIIIVSILIIFFMCKRRDDPIYKVAEVPQQQIMGGGGPGGVPVAAGPGGGAGGGGVGGRKPGVKEWYV